MARNGEMMRVEVDTHSLSLLEFETGVIGSMMISFDVWDSETPRFEIYGEEGTICIADPDPVHGANVFGGEVLYRTRDTSRWTHQPRPAGRDSWQVAECLHGYNVNSRGLGLLDLAHAVAERRPPRQAASLPTTCLKSWTPSRLPQCRPVQGGRKQMRTAGPAAPVISRLSDLIFRECIMPVKSLELAAPFFTVDFFVTEEPSLMIAERAIFLNLGVAPVRFEAQQLAPLQSAILANVEVRDVERQWCHGL